MYSASIFFFNVIVSLVGGQEKMETCYLDFGKQMYFEIWFTGTSNYKDVRRPTLFM